MNIDCKNSNEYIRLFTKKDEAYLLYSINLDTIEVIGNKFENPELLGGE